MEPGRVSPPMEKAKLGDRAGVEACTKQIVERGQTYALPRRLINRQVFCVTVVIADIQVKQDPLNEVTQIDGGLGAVVPDKLGTVREAWGPFCFVFSV